MMTQTILIGLWITIFSLTCVGVKQAMRQRARQYRHAQRQDLRRFTGDYSSHRRSRSRSRRTAYSPVAA